jgi:pilus assembly protein Flp/PilA
MVRRAGILVARSRTQRGALSEWLHPRLCNPAAVSRGERRGSVPGGSTTVVRCVSALAARRARGGKTGEGSGKWRKSRGSAGSALRDSVKTGIYCTDNLPLVGARIAGFRQAAFACLKRRTEEETSMSKIRKFFKSDLGATAIEYGLIAALIAVVIIAALQLTGNSLKTVFNNVGGVLNSAAN